MAGCQVTAGPSSEGFGDASVPPPGAGGAEASTNEAGGDSPSTTAADPQPGTGDGGISCPAVQPQSCPSPGAACTQIGANCAYGDWCCACGEGMKQWYCSKTDAVDPCPAQPPKAGAPCYLDAVGCTYCTPQGLLRVECIDTTPTPGSMPSASNQQFAFFAPECESTIPSDPPPDAGTSGD